MMGEVIGYISLVVERMSDWTVLQFYTIHCHDMQLNVTLSLSLSLSLAIFQELG